MSANTTKTSAATAYQYPNTRLFIPFDILLFAPYTAYTEVRFAPEIEAKLNQLAADRELTPESLVREAVERLIHYDEWFIREVENGLSQIDCSALVEHQEIGARLDRLLAQKRRSC